MGEQIWGRTKKRLPSGAKKCQRRDEKDWITVQLPSHLRIVTPELWHEVEARWENVRQLYLRATNGKLHGQPTNGRESPYLFTGFTQCKTCLGSLCIRSRSHGKRRAFHYTCSTHYLRGPERCAESMLIPLDVLDQDILETLERDILNPAQMLALSV